MSPTLPSSPELLALAARCQALEQALADKTREVEALRTDLNIQLAVFDAIPYPVFHHDAQARYRAVNRAYAEAYGQTTEDLRGSTVMQVLTQPEALRPVLLAEDLHLIATAGRVEREFRVPLTDGTVQDTLFRSVGYRNQDGSPGGMVGTMVDITERKKAEQVVRAMLQEQQAIFDAVSIGIAFMVDRRYRQCNRVMESMFGYAPGELLGQTSEALYGGHAAWVEAGAVVQAQIDQDSSFSEDRQMYRKDGSSIWISRRCRQIPLELGAEVMVWVYEDITDRKRAADELRQAYQKQVEMTEQLVRSEKLASLGFLVAGVSHELNTPIGNALLTASTLHSEVQAFNKKRLEQPLTRSALEQHLTLSLQATDLLTRNLERAAELVSGFKQLTVDQTSEQRRQFDLSALAHEVDLVMSPQLRHGTAQLQIKVPDGLQMDSYPGSLTQICINFINNALMHAFEGRSCGCMELSARSLDEERVEIAFSDDGCGMPLEVQRRVFDPFFTTKLGQGGSGLGMHIVYNMVTQALGGSITVDSAPGQGTRWIMNLPRRAP